MLLSNCHVKFIFPLALAVEESALGLIFFRFVFIMFAVSCFISFETNDLISENKIWWRNLELSFRPEC